jgi:succinoglycan biosynthesis transport protein ExoP
MQDANLDPKRPGGDVVPALPERGQLAVVAPPQQPLSLNVRSDEPAAGGDEVDLLSYWRILVKRKWTVLASLAIVLATALVGTLLMTPIYRASATLQIDRDTMQVVQIEGMPQVEGSGANDFYQTQYELLKSRALAERVVGQLGLAGKGDQRLAPPSAWERLRAAVGLGDSSVETEGAAAARKRQVVAAFQKGIVIEPVRNSRLVQIHYDSPDPAFSTKAANALAEGFMASNLEHGFEASAYAKSYLEDRLQELRLKLEDSERKLVAFAQKEQIISSGGESGTLTEQSLGSINTALSKAKEDRIRVESRWRQAQGARGTALPADMLFNSSIRPLQETRSKLMAEYQDKLRLYKPAYPTMLALKGQIDELDKQIGQEVGNIKASINAEYQAALNQEALLTAQLGGLKNETLDLQGRSIQYNIYKREVDTNRQLYDGLLQRYKEIGVAGGVTTNNISIVDRAANAFKFKPSLQLNLALALLFGLVLGILLALVFEYMDDTIKAPEDIEKQLGLSVVGVIPRLKPPMTPDQASEDPRSAFAESYRSVRTALQFSTDAGVPRCLLVTSATPSEGKSTTALTLARNFAQLGKRVLLIDADLRNPSLHRALKAENTAGLSNYLAGAAKANDVLQQTSIPHLSFMSSGPLPPNPAELLVGPKLLSLLTVAMEKFDQVIVDGPPVMGLADAAILGNSCAGTLLVVHAGETRIAIARNALKRLLAARTRVVGALLTQYAASHSATGYGYGDYSYYQYGGKEPAKLALK